MKNPNGFGSITKLKGNRRRPWMVREGKSGKQIVIGYTRTKAEGLTMLAEYNKSPYDIDAKKMTVSQVFDLVMATPAERMSEATKEAHRTAWNYIKHMGNRAYYGIKSYEMQETIDACPKTSSIKKKIRTLWAAMDRLAYDREVISTKRSESLSVPTPPPTNRSSFTPAEIQIVKEHEGEFFADLCLILLYSGFRISEAYQLDQTSIDFDEMIFRAGVKTKAGKNRIVPIHPAIVPIVKRMLEEGNGKLAYKNDHRHLSQSWKKYFHPLGVDRTVHETRHTFESKLDSAGANRACIDKLMGHSPGSIGERVYTHKTIEELRETILLLNY